VALGKTWPNTGSWCVGTTFAMNRGVSRGCAGIALRWGSKTCTPSDVRVAQFPRSTVVKNIFIKLLLKIKFSILKTYFKIAPSNFLHFYSNFQIF
jgi:hypothetical protein